MGSSSAPAYTPPSGAPGFMLSSPAGIQNLATQFDQASYTKSDQDFNRRYPGLVAARGVEQNSLRQAQSEASQSGLQSSAAITGLSQDLTNRRANAANVNGIGNSITASGLGLIDQGKQANALGMGYAQQGQGFLDTSKQIIGQGQGFLNQVQPLVSQGQGIINQAQPTMAAGAEDIALGGGLIRGDQPLDPMIQQQMMRSGLSSAAGSLGAGNISSGSAGQAAVARNLGLNISDYIKDQRAQGMSLQGTGANLQGTATNIIGAGTNVMNTGINMGNLGNSTIGAGTGVGGLGTNVIGAGTSLMGQGTNMQSTGSTMGIAGQGLNEQYAMDNASLANQIGSMNQAQQNNANAMFSSASDIFKPRTFGIGGQGAAQIALQNTAGVNSAAASAYASKVQGSQLNSQIAAGNASSANAATGQAIGAGTTAAVTGATVAAMSCWVARAVLGTSTEQWKHVRHYVLNQAPKWLRRGYCRHGEALADWISDKPVLKSFIRAAMLMVVDHSPYARIAI